jgi:2-methylisocitrate lyase-like PEP mutase family enzyme
MSAPAFALHHAVVHRPSAAHRHRASHPRSSVRSNAGGFDAMMTSLRKLRAVKNDEANTSSPNPLDGVSFDDHAPSWDELAAIVSELKTTHGIPLVADLENGPASPHALTRRFGTSEDDPIRVMFCEYISITF